MEELLPLPSNWYDYLSVHQEMLEDSDRLKFFYKSLERFVRPDSIVMDIGTGTGILALMAAKLGAQRVYAVDNSKIIEVAKAIAIKNGLHHKIQFIKENSLKVQIPERVDIIVSEMIGHCGFEEHCLSIFEDAQNRFLKNKGTIIPSQLNLYGVPISSREYSEKEAFYKNKVFGLDISLVFEKGKENIFVEKIGENDFLSEPQKLLSFEFVLPYKKTFEISKDFKIDKTSKLNGVALWFDTCLGNMKLSSGPFGTSSHWQSAVFYFKESLLVKSGDRFAFNLSTKDFTNAASWQWSGCLQPQSKQPVSCFSPGFFLLDDCHAQKA